MERLIAMKPEDTELMSQRARLAQMEAKVELKKGGSEVEDIQKELQARCSACPCGEEVHVQTRLTLESIQQKFGTPGIDVSFRH